MKKIRLFSAVLCTLCLVGCFNTQKSVDFEKSDFDDSFSINLTFDAAYFRTNGYSEGEQYPNVFWIANVNELEDYVTAASERYDFNNGEDGGLAAYVKKYDSAFFEAHDLIFMVLEEPSGSISHRVTSVKAEHSEQNRVQYHIQPYIERNVPEIGTCDMAQWHIIIEIAKEYGAMHSDIKAPAFTE